MGINPTVRYYEKNAFQTIFGKRIRMIRFFQEAMSVIMMGRFISHYGRISWVKLSFEERVSHVINAYIYFLQLPCLISFFGKEIRENPFLDQYFSRFIGYVKWRSLYDAGNLPTPTITTMFDFFSALGYKMGFEYILGKIGDLIGYPILFQQFLYDQFPEEAWVEGANPFFVVDWVNQNLNRDDFDIALTVIPSYLWYPINPFIHLDWAVLKSYIVLWVAYRKIREQEEAVEFVPPYIKGMKLSLIVDGKKIQDLVLNDEGYASICIPKKDVEKGVRFSLMGLDLDIPFYVPITWDYKTIEGLELRKVRGFDFFPYDKLRMLLFIAWNYYVIEEFMTRVNISWDVLTYQSLSMKAIEGWEE